MIWKLFDIFVFKAQTNWTQTKGDIVCVAISEDRSTELATCLQSSVMYELSMNYITNHRSSENDAVTDKFACTMLSRLRARCKSVDCSDGSFLRSDKREFATNVPTINETCIISKSSEIQSTGWKLSFLCSLMGIVANNLTQNAFATRIP